MSAVIFVFLRGRYTETLCSVGRLGHASGLGSMGDPYNVDRLCSMISLCSGGGVNLGSVDLYSVSDLCNVGGPGSVGIYIMWVVCRARWPGQR